MALVNEKGIINCEPKTGAPPEDMSMMMWYATEGGRKCPQCGRYAKPKELGWTGAAGPGIIIDAYGHLPGKGCNRRRRRKYRGDG